MSKEIDEKVVSMKFDNQQFMRNTEETMTRLEKLKASLHLSGAAKGFEDVNNAINDTKLSPLGVAAEQVGLKFSALQVMAATALANITNAAVNAGKKIVSALTIEPVKMGFQEYETQINAVQTILANTESKGTTLEDVNGALDKLNTYADKTIYNFTEMTRNIGTFTAAGVDLDTSVNAIQGIANLAAVSGSTSQQASTAMYQLSQALSSGTVRLMDWNSVVNAGMGGQVFQDALKETARVHGIAIDDMIDEHGSFRETLKEEWLTSEILTETLQKFTLATEGMTDAEIEKNRAMLKSKGYTDEQIDGIFKLGNTATNAATKVKTFTQLMDTLKESAQSGWTQTWEILVGDFEEAKNLWTSVSDIFGKIIGDAAEARNTMLQGWADGGGRDMMLESFKNVFDAIVSIVGPVKEAFREIFPKTTAEQLLKISEAIKEFTSKLILSEKAQAKLKSAFKGLFAVIDIGLTAIKEVAKGIGKLLTYFVDLAKEVLGVSGSFGDWVSGVRDTIKESGVFGTVIGGIVKILQKFADALKIVLKFLKEKFVAPGFEGFLAVLSGLWNILKFVADKIMQVLGALGKGLLNAFRSGDFKAAVDVFNTGVIAAILLNIKKFTKNFTGSLGEISDIAGSVGGILDSVKGCFEAWQQDIQAKTLMKIASAIAILAAAILVIASIEPDRLTSSLGAVTVLFGELMGSMAIFTHIGGNTKGIVKTSIAMIAMSTAVLILASALKKVSSIDPSNLATGLLGVAALSGIVVVVAKTMSSNTGTIIKGATGLIAFALAIKILASACDDLSTMSWEGMAKGLVGVGVLMAAVSLFLNNSKFSVKAIAAGTGMLILAAAIKVLASACGDFATMSWEEIGKGLAAIAASLLLITLAMNFMPAHMLLIGVGLLAVSAALVVLSSALNSMGGMSWEEIGKSLVALGGALALLALGLYAMSSTIAGSAALTIAAIAIGLLVPSLLILGSMSWESILKGLASLAGTFLVLGLAGLVLGPLVPVILGLGAAIALIGVGVLAAGVGLVSLATGLTALAAAFAAGGNIILMGITAIATAMIGFVPVLVGAIGEGIILLCKTIAGSVGAICEALAAVIIALCDAIIKSVPKLLDTVGVLLDKLLKFILKYVPKIVKAGIDLIIALLEGIGSKIGAVAEKAVYLMTQFLKAIATQYPKLIDAGMKMVIDFVNGIADAIEDNVPELMKAATNLGTSIVKGVVKGLVSMPGVIWDAVCEMGQSIIDAICEFLGINSPAKAMIPIGRYIDEGLAVGIEKHEGAVTDAAENIGTTAINSMSNAISSVADLISMDIDSQPTIRPVLDLSNIKNGAGAINDMFGMSPSVDVLSNVGTISTSMNNNQNGRNFDVVSALKDLGNKLNIAPGNTYIIDGVTYDDGSNVANAVESIVRAARIERRI